MEVPSTNHKPYQSDVLIFLVLIPLISAFNYYLTYTDIHLNGFLLLTFTIDTVRGTWPGWVFAILSFISIEFGHTNEVP